MAAPSLIMVGVKVRNQVVPYPPQTGSVVNNGGK